jgi:hypothetical protein
MTAYESIKKIDKLSLKGLVKCGFISPNIERDLQIYEMVSAYIKTGSKLMDACLKAEDLTNIKELAIYLIYKKLGSEVNS